MVLPEIVTEPVPFWYMPYTGWLLPLHNELALMLLEVSVLPIVLFCTVVVPKQELKIPEKAMPYVLVELAVLTEPMLLFAQLVVPDVWREIPLNELPETSLEKTIELLPVVAPMVLPVVVPMFTLPEPVRNIPYR